MAAANIKNFELKIGKAGLIIIVAGMAAFLCTAFLFGVDVGKNIDTYPEKIASLPQRALALVWRPAKIRVAQNATDNKSEQHLEEENIDLTFYDALTTKKGIQKAESVSEKQPLVLQQKKEEEAVKGDFNIEAQKPSSTVSEKNTVIKDPKVKEAAADIASGKSKFIVQVASLKEKKTADRMSTKIASIGFKSEIIKIDIKGKGIMFRVIASGFENKTQAQQAAQKISSQTTTNCIVKSFADATRNN